VYLSIIRSRKIVLKKVVKVIVLKKFQIEYVMRPIKYSIRH